MLDTIVTQQIRQVRQENERLKGEFRAHVDELTSKVEQFSDEMLLKTTVLDDLYTNGTQLADRKADNQLLKDFDKVSPCVIAENCNMECEIRIPLQLPYLQIGNIRANQRC